jgi:hypothetical protein
MTGEVTERAGMDRPTGTDRDRDDGGWAGAVTAGA